MTEVGEDCSATKKRTYHIKLLSGFSQCMREREKTTGA